MTRYNVTDQFPGGAVEFNICWQIESDDADSLVMYVESFLTFDAPPTWFSLGNPIDEPVDESQPASTPIVTAPDPVSEPSPTPTAIPEQASSSNDSVEIAQNSTRGNPVAVGQAARVGDYEITVVSAVPNANDVIGNQSLYLEPLAPGHQYYLVTLSTTYVGVATGNPSFELDYQAVGASNSSYSGLTNSCGALTNDFLSLTEQFPGGTSEYAVCWQVESTDADSLVMYVDSFLDFNGQSVWFSLQP